MSVHLCFVDPTPEIAIVLTCNICTGPIVDAIIHTKCGNSFCLSCTKRHIASKTIDAQNPPKCPLCRADLIGDLDANFVPNLSMRQILDMYDVKCMHGNTGGVGTGCSWVGSSSSYSKHKSSCEHVLRPCELYACESMITQKQYSVHFDACVMETLICAVCKKQVPRGLMSSSGAHFGCKAEDKVRCAGCRKVLPSNHDLLLHKYVCTERLVPCEYAFMGCSQWVKANNFHAHNTEFTLEHEALIISHTQFALDGNPYLSECQRIARRRDLLFTSNVGPGVLRYYQLRVAAEEKEKEKEKIHKRARCESAGRGAGEGVQ